MDTSEKTEAETASTVEVLPAGLGGAALRAGAVRALGEGRRVAMPICLDGKTLPCFVDLTYSAEWIRDLAPREVRAILRLAPAEALDTLPAERPPCAAQLGARLYRELLRHARALAAVEAQVDPLAALGRLGLPTVLARPGVVSEIVRRAVAAQLRYAEATGGQPSDVINEGPARWARIGVAVLHYLADGDEAVLELSVAHAQPAEVVGHLRDTPAKLLAAALGIERDGRGFDELVAHVGALRRDLEAREDRASQIVRALDVWLEARGGSLQASASPADVIAAVERVVERAAGVWQ